MMRRIAPLLLAALILSSLVAGDTCFHDKLFRDKYSEFPIAQWRYFYREGETRPDNENLETGLAPDDTYKPIRFTAGLFDLYGAETYCKQVGEKHYNFRGDLLTCTAEDVLSREKRDSLHTLVYDAFQFVEKRLLVRPLQRKIELQNYATGFCREFDMPEGLKKSGADGDFYLHVAAAPMGDSTIKAVGLACAELFGRPVSGALHVNPQFINTEHLSVRVLAHQILHALGFHTGMFKRKGMISTIENIRGKTNVPVISSSRVVAKAKEHYNCTFAPGLELEDQQEGIPVGSHWKRRNVKDDIMAAIAGRNFFTDLTIAALEDTGYYRGNYLHAEYMSYGDKAGCNLLTDKCVNDGVSEYKTLFSPLEPYFEILYCTSDRLGTGLLEYNRLPDDLPPQFMYFPPWNRGSPADHLMDYCPYVKLASPLHACSARNLKANPGSEFGNNSRCFQSWHVGAIYQTDTNEFVTSICADVICNKKEQTYKVLLAMAKKEWECPIGDRLLVHYASPVLTVGSIDCPPFLEVCGDVDSSAGAAHFGIAALAGCAALLLATLVS